MPHLKASKDDFDWMKLDFEWLKTAQYADISKMGKAVSMPDRVDLISIHFIARTQWPYKSIDVSDGIGLGMVDVYLSLSLSLCLNLSLTIQF